MELGQGMDVAQDTFGFGRFSVAAVAVGVMKRGAQFGLDSVTAVLLVDDLERRLGRAPRADLARSHSSIDVRARHLACEDAVQAQVAVS